MKSLIFTVTAGRTGTDWLSKFIQTNSSFHSIHEPIGIQDFGVKMPEIRIMRTFNEYGFSNDVKSFWSKKFKTIESIPAYSESNHTLGKCGLIEYMSNFTKLTDEVSIILSEEKIE